MNKIWKLFEYGYLLIAIFFAVETFLNLGKDKVYFFAIFSVLALGMFFFRRSFRKKFEKRNKQ
nr:hypothetical protein [Lutibacter sp.]